MAIITNTARTAETKIDSKLVSWGGSECTIPVSERAAILEKLGDIDPDFIIAFKTAGDDSHPYRVVFLH